MKTIKLLSILLSITFFISCSKDAPQEEVIPQTIVHAAGSEIIPSELGFAFPTDSYWKNNVKTLSGFSGGFQAKSVFVNNNKIYIAGQDQPASIQIPCYSENGTRVSLGTIEGTANSIYVKNNDIYVGGYTQTSDITTAKYWKNGVEFSLTNGLRDAQVRSVFVDGNDLYCAGNEENTARTVDQAKYWKNGVATILSTNASHLNSILVFGGDVYACGFEYNAAGKSVATIWKNSNKVDITDGARDAEAFELKILDGNTYIVFEEKNAAGGTNAKYCKIDIATGLNKQIVNLTTITNNKNASAKTIFLHNNDIYVGGSNPVETSAAVLATIWKNGIASTQSNNSGVVNSIFVSN
jgi:hypothetical protein